MIFDKKKEPNELKITENLNYKLYYAVIFNLENRFGC